MASTGIIENQFIETELNVSAKRTENLFRILFMLMAGLLILPVLIILTTLIVKGSPYHFLRFSIHLSHGRHDRRRYLPCPAGNRLDSWRGAGDLGPGGRRGGRLSE